MKKLKSILLIFITFALATLSNPLPISANNVDNQLHKSEYDGKIEPLKSVLLSHHYVALK